MTTTLGRPANGIGRYVKDPFPGLSHGCGALLGIAGLLVLLLTARSGAAAIVGVSIYGASLILLYTASCLAHSVRGSPRMAGLLDRLDYAAIFGLIAGTYTPICLTTLRGPWGWTFLSIEWTLACLGVIMVLLVGPRKRWVLMYVPMGWLVVVAAGPLLDRMAVLPLICLAIGGLIYSIGAIVFVSHRPRLWPGRFDSHDLWHTMVLIASGCHFAAVMQITAG